jgi:hypothetical protein
MKTSTFLSKLCAGTILFLAAAQFSSAGISSSTDEKNSYSSGKPSALSYIISEMQKENKKRIVYRDYGDGANLFTQRALLNPDPFFKHPVMNEAEPSEHGVSCVHVSYPLQPLSWNGFMFITGRLQAGSHTPELDFGEHNTGYDLRGATKLNFKARGKTGRERVIFYCGGLGIGTNVDFFDSDQVFLNKTGDNYITLTTEWKDYSIDLRGRNLTSIACGFAWVASQTKNQTLNEMEFDIDEIEYSFDSEIFEPLLLRSYAPLPLNDSRAFINNFSYTYDNAVVAILLAKSGNVKYAQQIADALAWCVLNDRYYSPGPIRNAYSNGSPKSYPGWLSPRNKAFAMLPGFYLQDKDFYAEDRYAVSVNVGVMAWCIEALLTVYDVAAKKDYLDAAIFLSDYIIENFKANDSVGGFTGGFEGWEDDIDKQRLTYKSVEHNLDLVSAYLHLSGILNISNPDKANKYREASIHARDFCLKLYDNGCFYTGTDVDGITPATANKPMDTNTWGILTLATDNSIASQWNPDAVYSFIQRTFRTGDGYDYNQDLDGEWREGEAHLALAALQLNKRNDYESILRHLNTVAEPDGSICSASKNGLTTGFDSLIAGENGLEYIAWTYEHRVSLASTAWLGLVQIEVNPYYANIPAMPRHQGLLPAIDRNPANGKFTISGLAYHSPIGIYDLAGHALLLTTASDHVHTIDTAHFHDGIYLVHVGKGSDATTLKLVVKH